jgi:hypothetical protein
MDAAAIGALASTGWFISTAATTNNLADEVHTIAKSLGDIVPGRGRQVVERIVPRAHQRAYAGSSSSKYGLGPLPLHTDTAHWPMPCRYLVIACAALGPIPTPTLLLNRRSLIMSEREVRACAQALFVIRNGSRSFYASVAARNGHFIRFDPGCMFPVCSDGELASRAFDVERHKSSLYRHEWKVGQILVIDNWQALHGRGEEERTETGRVLLRAMVR